MPKPTSTEPAAADPAPDAPATPVPPSSATAPRTAKADVPADRLPAGTYQYVGALPTQYLDVPLTARPADGDRPATVFAWPLGAPADGRWAPTKKKPNQVADNALAAPEGE